MKFGLSFLFILLAIASLVSAFVTSDIIARVGLLIIVVPTLIGLAIATYIQKRNQRQ